MCDQCGTRPPSNLSTVIANPLDLTAGITVGPQIPLDFIPTAELPEIIARDLSGNGKTVHCEYCDIDRSADEMLEHSEDEKPICIGCSITCESCSHIHNIQDNLVHYAEYDGRRNVSNYEYRCIDCSFKCADCNSRFHSHAGSVNSTGESICSRCSENYATCEGCSCVVHGDNNYGDDDGVYCRECWNNNRRNNEESDEEAEEETEVLMRSYEYKPAPSFHYGEGEKSGQTFIGIELETECKGIGPNDCLKAAKLDTRDDFYVKRDGSIDYGMEIVSHPGTYKYWQEADLSFCNLLKANNCRAYDTKTCGMHVHISKSALTIAQQAKLLLFAKHNAAFLLYVSRRANKSAMQLWAGIDDSNPRMLIRRVKSPTSYSDFREAGVTLTREQSRVFDRYCAINLNNAKTIEFRLFRGTLDIGSIRRNIAFVVALTAYMRECPTNATYEDFDGWLVPFGWKFVGRKMAMILSQWFSKFNPRATVNPTPQIELECA